MENKTKEPVSQGSIQDYLSLGYLYLLTLGILREVIYFGFLEVNILSYSNVLDVILSPLVLMSKKPTVAIILIAIGFITYFFHRYLMKKLKDSSLKPSSPDGKAYTKSDIYQASIFFYSLFVLSFFLGTGRKKAENIYSMISLNIYFWPLRLSVRTPGFHPGKRGSIPLGATSKKHILVH